MLAEDLSQESSRARHGVSERDRRRALAVILATAAATAFCIVVPRVGPLAVLGLTVALSLVLLLRGVPQRSGAGDFASLVLRPEAAFVGWVLVACLWATAPGAALAKAVFLAVLFLHAVVAARQIPHLALPDIEAAAKGILAGFFLGGIYLCLETETRDLVTRIVLTYFPGVTDGLDKHAVIEDGVVKVLRSSSHISRVGSAFCLFLCPAALAVALFTKGALRWLCYAVIAAFALLILLHPAVRSQTAQLSTAVALITFAITLVSRNLAKWLLGAGFVAAVFFVVPFALGLFHLKMHENDSLFSSARARIIIWNYTAERVLETPVLGVGTNSTRYIDDARPEHEKLTPPGALAAAATRAHPHNVYLQIWYELGIIGAVAFAALGLSLLWRASRLPSACVPFALVHFAVCATVITPSYGLWQNWFQSAIVLSILALLLVGARRDAFLREADGTATDDSARPGPRSRHEPLPSHPGTA